LLFGIIFLVLNIGLGSWGLTETSEARYAEIGREMFRSGDYLHPTLMGIRHYHKPPLTYYVTALGYEIFGVNEYGARFFLSVAFVIILLLIYKTSLLLFQDKVQAISAVVLLCSFPSLLIASRVLTTDLYLLVFTVGSLYMFLRYRLKGGNLNLYGFFALMGLGVLTKGPAIFIPVGMFLICWGYARKERPRLSLHLVLGFLLFFTIGGAWFLAVMGDNPKFLDYFISTQIIHRAIAADDMHRSKPFWYYIVLLPVLGFPWLPILIVEFSTARYRIRNFFRQDILKILAFTALLILLAFSFISSKLIPYILPVFPLLALLGGRFIPEISERRLKTYTLVFLGLCLLLLAALGVMFFIPEIQVEAGWLLLLAASICLSIIIARYRRGLNSLNRLMLLSLIFSAGILLTFTLFASQNPRDIKTYKEVITRIRENKRVPLNTLFIYNIWVPSASFYLDRDVVTIKEGDERVDRDIRFEKDSLYKNTLIDLEVPEDLARLEQMLKKKNQAFLRLQKDTLPENLNEAVGRFPHKDSVDRYIIYY